MKVYPIFRSAQEEDILGDAMKEALGLDKANSADCVAAIMAQPQFRNTNPKDWKRRSKHKDDKGNWVRTFENKSNGASVEVTEGSGGTIIGIRTIQGPAGGGSPGVIGAPGHWGPMAVNEIKLVPLSLPVDQVGHPIEVKWSGRCVFAFEESDEGEVSFTCGPEETDGALDDTFDGGCYDKLGEMFQDLPDTDIGAAENYHMIPIPPGMSRGKLRQIIRDRLLAAGAVPYGS